jgi:hypothetical protein
MHFPVDEGVGQPSRWTILRALRVLRWYAQGALSLDPTLGAWRGRAER